MNRSVYACDLMELFKAQSILEQIKAYERREIQKIRAMRVVEALKRIK